MSSDYFVNFHNIQFVLISFQADRISHSTTSTNDYNGDYEEEADYDGSTPNFQRNGMYSTYPPKGVKKRENMSFSRRMEHAPVDESLSETSEYQSDNGYGEVIEDISNGPVSSTPSMKRIRYK